MYQNVKYDFTGDLAGVRSVHEISEVQFLAVSL